MYVNWSPHLFLFICITQNHQGIEFTKLDWEFQKIDGTISLIAKKKINLITQIKARKGVTTIYIEYS